jgi:hypothetical protein
MCIMAWNVWMTIAKGEAADAPIPAIVPVPAPAHA